MKFLIAFAVIAVAFAAEEVKVVHLPPAPAPAFETPDFLPFIAPASIFEALRVPMPIEILRGVETPVEEALTVLVRDIPYDSQNEDMKVRVYDGPIDAVVNAAFEQLEPVRVAEIPMTNEPEMNKGAQGYDGPIDPSFNAPEHVKPVRVAEIPMIVAENIAPLAESEVNVEAPIEPVKVAVIETNEVPIEKVKVMDPFSMLPRYDDPVLR